MSLLDSPPHMVEVEVVEKTADRYGEATYQPTGEFTPVRCAVQPVSEQERVDKGLSLETRMRIITRSWPGSIHQRIRWNGCLWEQVGEAAEYRMSPRTSHYDVLILKIGEVD